MTAIMIIGEAWGETEERERSHFVGPSGYELTRMLSEAGINRSSCYLTNVFHLHPRGNAIESLCGPRTESLPGYPAIVKGKFLRREFLPELERLQQEIMDVNPNIIICMGNTALWALLGTTGISNRRGSIVSSTYLVEGFKVLPTYHPAAVLRDWSLRPVTILDLHKARRESAFPEVIRPSRQIYIEPSLIDIAEFYDQHIPECRILSVDIETVGDQITCIGFAPSSTISLVVPFTDFRRASGSYWPNRSDELCAWGLVRRFLEAPCGKVFQNGLYDISFLWRSYGLRVVNPQEDTMLLHHALQPESPKGLAFLGSVYTNEASWKLMRKHTTTIKRDE